MERVLKHNVRQTPSFLLDTADFFMLKSVNNISSGSLLVTLDVSSLYTSIPHSDGLSAVRSFLTPDNCPSSDGVFDLIKFVLEHNVFSFGDKLYLQKHGTAMGSKMTPQYANLFMARLENDFLNGCSLKPDLYLRYIDDIFLIWPHGDDSLMEFHHQSNSHQSDYGIL